MAQQILRSIFSVSRKLLLITYNTTTKVVPKIKDEFVKNYNEYKVSKERGTLIENAQKTNQSKDEKIIEATRVGKVIVSPLNEHVIKK